jgi:two-component system, sensor histidine kinase
VSETTERRPDRDQLPSQIPTGVLRVLLVEDNEEGREALGELLSLWGCAVSEAADGEDGVAKALAERPRLAMVDIGLPDIDGYEVARRIRESEDGEHCRLVALTGYGQPEDRRRALAAGFDQYMVKPIAPARVRELLDSLRKG